MNLLVGTGGWAYFNIPERSSLEEYASAFNFVEVNSSYYDYPDLRTAYGWRKRVPAGFTFSVRCHRSIAKGLLSQESLIVSTLDKMEPICGALNADILAVLVPANVNVPEQVFSKRLETLLSSFHSKGTKIAVEFRNGRPSLKTIQLLADNDAVHSVDLSREEPATESSILYSRLFGKGGDNIYEFDDGELKTILDKASAPRYERSILAFHGVRMYRDAARATTYLTKGEFPKITDYAGLASLREVLSEDSIFPSSLSNLVEHQGWKLFDLSDGKRARAGDYLSRLPEGKYESLEQVMNSLQEQFPPEIFPDTMTAHASGEHSS